MIDNSSFISNETHGAARWEAYPEIIALSGQNRTDLKTSLNRLRGSISGGTNLPSICAETRRCFSFQHACRLLMVLEKPDDIMALIDQGIAALENSTEAFWNDRHLHYGEMPCPGKLAFAFPGQGSQYVMMGRDLVMVFPEARKGFWEADRFFDPGRKLTDVVFPEIRDENDEKIKAEEALRATDIAQPAIGAVSCAMIGVLKRFGVVPDAACGHSYGELAALFASGRFDEQTFFELSVARGKFMARAGGSGDKGGMLAVKAPMEALETLIRESGLDVVLANRNSPDQGVLSGPTTAISAMKDLCREKKLRATILPVAAAFHSRLVQDAAEPFAQTIAAAEFLETGLPVYSNTTGCPYPSDPEAAKKLLGTHLMNPVRFVEEIETMHADGIRLFLEVGPRAVLTGLIKAILKDRPGQALAVDGSSGRHSGMADLARCLCLLASLGYPVILSEWKKA